MKKALAILLALLMLTALFAGCTEKDPGTSTPPSDNADTSPTEDVAEEKLTLVYICSSLALQWCQDIADSIESYGEDNNFELISADTGRVNEKFIQLVETYCDQKVDGFFLSGPEEITERIYEIINPTGIPYLGESVAQWNSSFTELLTPGVELNAKECGAGCGTWLGENYKEYFSLGDDVDLNEVGYIPITYTANTNFTARSDGATEALKAAIPGFVESNIYLADCVKQGALTADAAYQEVAAIIAGNPNIKYWLVAAILDDLGQGAARAVDAAGRNDDVLIASVGGEVLVKEWDTGYEGCWKMCNFFQAMDYSSNLVPAMMKLIREGASYEDLWPDNKIEGQEYSSIRIKGTTTTKETYGDLYRWKKGDPHPTSPTGVY